MYQEWFLGEVDQGQSMRKETVIMLVVKVTHDDCHSTA